MDPVRSGCCGRGQADPQLLPFGICKSELKSKSRRQGYLKNEEEGERERWVDRGDKMKRERRSSASAQVD